MAINEQHLVGVKELNVALDKLSKESVRMVKLQIKATAYRIRDDYKSAMAPHRKTGQLEKSIIADTKNDWLSAEIGSTADQAVYLELGTKRHYIAPVNTQALHWKEGGVDRFSKGHYVKGIKAGHKLQSTFDRDVQGIEERLVKLIASIKL